MREPQPELVLLVPDDVVIERLAQLVAAAAVKRLKEKTRLAGRVKETDNDGTIIPESD